MPHRLNKNQYNYQSPQWSGGGVGVSNFKISPLWTLLMYNTGPHMHVLSIIIIIIIIIFNMLELTSICIKIL